MKIGFCGLGACGSNIVDLFDQDKYTTIAINASSEDLECLDLRNKLLLGNKGGSGKVRNEAKAEIKKYYTKIIEYIKNKFSDTDLIYLVFSSGGGFGSGAGPILLDVLKQTLPTKRFAAITVLPSTKESLIAQKNSLDCMKELSTMEIPLMILDNDKFYKDYEVELISTQELYTVVNEALIESFDIITKNRKASKFGNIDTRDMFKLLTTNGNMLISKYVIGNEVNRTLTLEECMIDSFKNNYFATLSFTKAIKRAGFIYELPDNTPHIVNYKKINNELGNILEVFEGIYKDNYRETSVISILTGLAFPTERLELISNLLSKGKDQVNLDKPKPLDFSSSYNWFDDNTEHETSTIITDSDCDDIDLSSIFDKY